MKYFWCLFLCIVLLFSCSVNDQINSTATLSLSNAQLPSLKNGMNKTYYYKLWMLLNGTGVYVGDFTINSDGTLSTSSYTNVDVFDLSAAQGMALTLSSTAGSTSPGNLIVLAGTFQGHTCTLSTTQSPAIGYQASVKYKMYAPTNLGGSWYTNIWYNDGNTALMNLSFYPKQFSYTSWLSGVNKSGGTEYFYMGTATANNTLDSSNLYIPSTSQPNVPSFPGEDFVSLPTGQTSDFSFPLDIRGKQLSLTVCPSDYTSTTAPFPFILFDGTLPTDAVQNGVYALALKTNYSLTVTR